MEFKLKKCTFTDSVITGVKIQPSAEVLAYANNISRELSNEQLVAFDNFVTNLKKGGIWDKITHLYIPSLAYVENGKNVREAFIDVVSSFGETPTYGIDKELAESNFTYKGGGISNKKVEINLNRKGASFINGETINDSHVMFLVKSGTASISQEGIEVYDRGFCCGVFDSPYRYINGDNYNIYGNNGSDNFTSNNKSIEEGKIFGHTVLDNKGNIIEASTISDTDFELSNSTKKNFPENIMFGTSEIQLSFGLVSFGKGLTKEQAAKYIQYITDLMNVL